MPQKSKPAPDFIPASAEVHTGTNVGNDVPIDPRYSGTSHPPDEPINISPGSSEPDFIPDNSINTTDKGPQYSGNPYDPSNRTITGEPLPGDERNAAQHWMDNLITPDPRREEWQSAARNTADDFARHVASNFIPLVSHPIESFKGLASSVGNAIANPDPDFAGPGTGPVATLLRPLIEKSIQDYQQYGPMRGTSDLLGTGVGMLATGELGGEAGDAASKPLLGAARAVGAPMERIGYGAINDALGARGPKPFQWGHNPARGALEEGVVPAISKQSSSAAIEPAMNRVGGRISNAVESATDRIPLSDTSASLEGPVNRAMEIEQGPGLGGPSSDNIGMLLEKAKNPAPGASQAIYRPAPPPLESPFDPSASIHNTPLLSGTADVSAPDLWKSIQNIDNKTRYKGPVAPEIEGLNDIQRAQRAGLRGNLEQAVPDIAAPSRTYGDLSGARDAIDRTIHSGQSLAKITDLIKYPTETYGGAALVNGGRALQSISPTLLRRIGAGSGTTNQFLLPQENQ